MTGPCIRSLMGATVSPVQVELATSTRLNRGKIYLFFRKWTEATMNGVAMEYLRTPEERCRRQTRRITFRFGLYDATAHDPKVQGSIYNYGYTANKPMPSPSICASERSVLQSSYRRVALSRPLASRVHKMRWVGAGVRDVSMPAEQRSITRVPNKNDQGRRCPWVE